MKILYNFPSRSRPSKCLSCLDNIIEMSTHDDWVIVLKYDSDDESMNNELFFTELYKRKISARKNGGRIRTFSGDSISKIHAVNRDVQEVISYEDAQIICTHSDDMVWQKKGFDSAILSEYDNGFKGLLHIPDQYASIRLITYPIMHVEYYNIDKYIYNPIYTSVYADCEQQEVAKIRGQYKLLPSHGMLLHAHHIAGYGEADELLLKTENPIVYSRDASKYEKRKSINFGL